MCSSAPGWLHSKRLNVWAQTRYRYRLRGASARRVGPGTHAMLRIGTSVTLTVAGVTLVRRAGRHPRRLPNSTHGTSVIKHVSGSSTRMSR